MISIGAALAPGSLIAQTVSIGRVTLSPGELSADAVAPISAVAAGTTYSWTATNTLYCEWPTVAQWNLQFSRLISDRHSSSEWRNRIARLQAVADSGSVDNYIDRLTDGYWSVYRTLDVIFWASSGHFRNVQNSGQPVQIEGRTTLIVEVGKRGQRPVSFSATGPQGYGKRLQNCLDVEQARAYIREFQRQKSAWAATVQ